MKTNFVILQGCNGRLQICSVFIIGLLFLVNKAVIRPEAPSNACFLSCILLPWASNSFFQLSMSLPQRRNEKTKLKKTHYWLLVMKCRTENTHYRGASGLITALFTKNNRPIKKSGQISKRHQHSSQKNNICNILLILVFLVP